MRESGWTFKEIEAITGVPWSTVRSRCRSLNIKQKTKVIRSRNRRPKWPHPKWLLELMYIECQLSTTEIAYELDLSNSTINKLLIHHKIPKRNKSEARKIYMQRYPNQVVLWRGKDRRTIESAQAV